MIARHSLTEGARVDVVAPSHELRLQSDTGTVVGSDRWADYYLIRLDQPALYVSAEGQVSELSEVAEDIDNLEELVREES